MFILRTISGLACAGGVFISLGLSASAVAAPCATDTTPVVTASESFSGQNRFEGDTIILEARLSCSVDADLAVKVQIEDPGSFINGGRSDTGDVNRAGRYTLTVPSGQSGTYLDLWTENDLTDEPDNKVTFRILDGTGYTKGTGGSDKVVVTVIDDELAVTSLSAARETVNAGQSVTLTISRTGQTAEALPYTIEVWSDALVGAGYQTFSGTIPARQRSHRQTIPTRPGSDANYGSSDPKHDLFMDAAVVWQDNREVDFQGHASVRVKAPTSTLPTPEYVVIEPPTVTLTKTTRATSVVEGTAIGFRVNLSKPPPRDGMAVTVGLSQTGAVLASTASRTATVAAGARSATFQVATVDDAVSERHSEIRVYLEADPSQAVVVAVRDNDKPKMEFVANPVEQLGGVVYEGEAIVFVLKREPIEYLPVTAVVQVHRRNHSSTVSVPAYINVEFGEGDLYGNGVLTFPYRGSVDRLGDFRLEIVRVDYRSGVSHSQRRGYSLVNPPSDKWIAAKNDIPPIEAPVTLSTPSSVREGSTAVITLNRVPGAEFSSIQVITAFTGGWPISREACHTVQFGRADRATLRVPVPNDVYDLGNIALEVHALPSTRCENSSAVGNSGSELHSIEIIDNDSRSSPPQVSVYRTGPASVEEGGSTQFRFQRTGSTAKPLTAFYFLKETTTEVDEFGIPIGYGGHNNVLDIDWDNILKGCRGNEATRGCGKVQFAAGESRKTVTVKTQKNHGNNTTSLVTVQVHPDYAQIYWGAGSKESPEWIAHPTRPSAQFTVTDNGVTGIPTIEMTRVGDADLDEDEEIHLRLTRTGGTQAMNYNLNVAVNYEVVGDFAPHGIRYHRMPANQGTFDIKFSLNDDNTAELDGSVTATLVDGPPYNVTGTLSHRFTVEDDDPYLEIDTGTDPSTSAIAVDEGNTVTVTIKQVGRRLHESHGFQWITRDGSATRGADFTAGQNRSTILFQDISQYTISIPTIDDAPLDDGGEVFHIDLNYYAQLNRIGFRLKGGAFLGERTSIRVTINNDGALPKAWVAEYGHASGTEVVDAIAGRMDGDNTGMWTRLTRKSFEGGGVRGRLAGMVAGGDIASEDGTVRLGMAVAANDATGTLEDYELTGELAGFYPYARWSPRPGLALWGAVGHAFGEISVKRRGTGKAMVADMTSDLVAIGTRTVLFDDDRLRIDHAGSGMWVRSESEDTAEMRGAVARSYRYRSELAGTYELEIEPVTLVPRAHARFERNGGDIEGGIDRVVGAGLDLEYESVGAGLTLERSSDDETRGEIRVAIDRDGLGAELVAARGISGASRTDVSGMVTYDRDRDRRGLVASFEPEWDGSEGYEMSGRVGYGIDSYLPFLGWQSRSVSLGVEWMLRPESPLLFVVSSHFDDGMALEFAYTTRW